MTSMKKPLVKTIARILMFALTFQIIFPITSHALTSGPSQPEVQSFEPVGTTEMVNMFTGDFVYNIPLLDVEGYPVNISYHSGVGIEQEASWVGLGWNINPGEINRSVRGLPDDFNGDRIEKEINIREEKNVRVGYGVGASLELAGADPKYADLNIALSYGIYGNFNNYKGTSVGAHFGAGLSGDYANAGINLAIGSQSGADMDLTAGVGYKSSHTITSDAGVGIGFSASGGTGFNSRSGLKDLTFNVGISASLAKNNAGAYGNAEEGFYGYDDSKASIGGISNSSTVPIGMQNYVPVITNAPIQKAFQIQLKAGGEIYYAYPYANASAHISKVNYQQDGSRAGFGYLYSEDATDEGIMDFSRDKDGVYNKSLQNLPLASMTYDVYSVSGHGTGGMFRPFRNDIGTVYDPLTKGTSESNDVALEFGFGNLFEIGSDVNIFDNTTQSGPWEKLSFRGGKVGSLFEKVYFKQAGELTYNQQASVPQLYNLMAQYVEQDKSTLSGKATGSLPAKLDNANVYWNGSTMDRTSRANLLTYSTAQQASVPDVALTQKISSFNTSAATRYFDPLENKRPRYAGNDYESKGHHIGEFTQTLPDGRRYIYGVPTINHATREVTFNVDEGDADMTSGLVGFQAGTDDSKNNAEGRDHFYSSTATPAHANSYLLSAVLSSDYVDVLGDGATDDDLGSYVKFNYTLHNDDYRWRAPYNSNVAQYNPGFLSDMRDGKGSYIVGSRQVWHLRSVESKNQIAEFYVSPRSDGQGAEGPVLTGSSLLSAPSGVNLKGTTAKGSSYKLDSIKLYNKHDRYIQENNAVAIKTIIFQYSNELCPGVHNSSVANGGKLTLKRLYVRYGKSDKSLLNPYVFSYAPINPAYDFAAKDRWGNYQKNNSARPNYEFPYVTQEGTGLDDSAAAWNLTDIKLPSGGKIHVAYERDDYAFVQDRRTMQMFSIEGFGGSVNLERKSYLYEDENTIYDYVYFKRRISRERSGLSLRDNYLEGKDILYYSFNLDITGNSRFENIKGYAKVEAIDVCPNDSQYGYIKLKREAAKNMLLHPATLYGLNMARYHLPHVLYPGYKDSDGDKKILEGLLAAAGELATLWQNPFKRFIKDKKARVVRTAKSCIRLNTPGLTKYGGGLRVKELTLSDNWSAMATGYGNTDAAYGKKYSYTLDDSRYGTISSGVASYEPLVGGDENPFRRPVPYTADGGRMLPAIEFFQEEPFGETFFPPAAVGYSRVAIRSIHYGQGRSAQSEEEHLYYTAKDFPVEVDYTQKEAPPTIRTKTLRRVYEEEKALQGYVLRFNDMHGKPKEINHYVINTDGNSAKPELITATKYRYQTDGRGKLDNNVKALVRVRGQRSGFGVGDITLGREMDFTVDSRSHYSRSYNRTIAANVNTVLWGIPPIMLIIPIPTAFFPDKETERVLHMMVSTKIVQQYGILKSVEQVDHGASTIVENKIYDAETGSVVLTEVNNQYNDKTFDLKFPAHMAYLGMGPAYTNDGYEEIVDSVVNRNGRSTLHTSNPDRFFIGDELLMKYSVPTSAGGTISRTQKVWVTDTLHFFDEDTIAAKGYLGCLVPSRCFLKIQPRYNDASGSSVFHWPDWNGKLQNVHVKVLRSGRRNRLDQYVQQTTLAKNPYAGNIADLFSNTTANGQAFNNLLAVSISSFSDAAQPYGEPVLGMYDTYPVQPDTVYNVLGSGSFIAGLNPIVQGRKGNYRPAAQWTRVGGRTYARNHSRYDGTFAIGSIWWQLLKGGVTDECDKITNALYPAGAAPEFWKKVTEITRYDIFGNALEEKDAAGNFSSAQFGFNRALATAVAANVQQNHFCFDGFEDYSGLVPANLYNRHFASHYLFAPLAALFKGRQTLSAFSNSNTASSPQVIRRSGQEFSMLDGTSSGSSGLAITTEAAHTGRHALKSGTDAEIFVRVSDSTDFVEQAGPFAGAWLDRRANRTFTLKKGRKYVLQMWVKPQSGTAVLTQFFTRVRHLIPPLYVLSISDKPLTAKTTNIEGWYLLEGIVDLSQAFPTRPTVSLNIPAGAYVDDIRIVPVDAQMKSFVYDPYSHRLVAQLDANHLATFYEYDQQGLLIRTKKETDRGILTVSESRRANVK